MEKEKATLYLSSAIGTEIIRAEGYLIDFKFIDYAQYKNTPQIDFIFKGKRNIRRFIKGYNPFFLILKGWDTPIIPDSLYWNISKSEGCLIKESKNLSHDEENYIIFNKFIEPLIKDQKVLFDHRFMIVSEQEQKKRLENEV